MIRDLYFGLAIVLTVVVGVWAAYGLRTAHKVRRTAWTLLAALAVFSAMSIAWIYIDRAMIEAQKRDDATAWKAVRRDIVARYPDMGELMALSPPIENMFKTSLVPIVHKYGVTGDQSELLAGASRASKQAYVQFIFPVVVHGDDTALNDWGKAQLRILQAVRAISVQACGDYAMTGINHYSPDPGVDAALSEAAHALVQAYKSSDAKKYGPPSREANRALFDKVFAAASPPFSDADRSALAKMQAASPPQQCDLTIRLLQSMGALAPADSANLYRVMMQTMAIPR